jgi:diketogulonate reductase-like aldo/keto reductase
MGKKDLSRREFLTSAAALSSAPIIASCSGGSQAPLSADVQVKNPSTPALKSEACPMPMRTLGNTGLKVSCLCHGCGTKFAALSNPAGRYASLDAAIAGGINYFDTCVEYGTASTLGNYFSAASAPIARDKVIIADKINARDYNGARNSVASELNLLKTSYIDIMLMHNIGANDDLTAFTGTNGAWTYLKEAKAAGLVRYIGFSSMDNNAGSGVLLTWINNFEMDVVTLAMNITGYNTLRTTTTQAANAKGIGVTAIKTVLGVVGAAHPIAACFGGLLNLKDPNGKDSVAGLIVGHDGTGFASGAAQVTANCDTMKGLFDCTGVLESYNIKELEESTKHLAGPHALPWARPGFKDDGKPYFWA